MTDLRKNFAGGLSRCEVGELVSDIGGDLVDKEDSYLVAERGLAAQCTLKTKTISDINARMNWSSLLYDRVTRLSISTMDRLRLRR
jgi:hypothetical protein